MVINAAEKVLMLSREVAVISIAVPQPKKRALVFNVPYRRGPIIVTALHTANDADDEHFKV
jgi:hypothetical protein